MRLSVEWCATNVADAVDVVRPFLYRKRQSFRPGSSILKSYHAIPFPPDPSI